MTSKIIINKAENQLENIDYNRLIFPATDDTNKMEVDLRRHIEQQFMQLGGLYLQCNRILRTGEDYGA